MKLAFQMSIAGLTAMLLASCGSTGSSGNNNLSGTGPFDSRGNYIEEWADNPSKWKRGGGRVPTKPGESLVMNDEPPADSIPIPTAENTRQPGQISSTPVIARNTQSSNSLSSTRRPSNTISRSGSGNSSTGRSSSSTVKSTSGSTRSASHSSARKPSAATASSKPKAKTKSEVAAKKPAPKKPASARYTVKKGDTLSAIAARNKTSVSALQRANGIKGSIIQPGKSLVIPK